LFPVGDEVNELGYVHMFTDMLNALESEQAPMESFYDGFVVNCIMDAAYRSAQTKRWEPVQIDDWRGSDVAEIEAQPTEYDADHFLIKQEGMPDGQTKLILKEKASGQIIEKITQ
jgi:hypothetical protein